MIPRRRRAALALATLAAPLLAGCDPCTGVIGGCRVARHVSYTGKVVDFATGRGVARVRVLFQRVSGAALTGDSLVASTDADGRYLLQGEVTGEGDVVGRVQIAPPAPLDAYVVDSVRLIPSTTRGQGDLLAPWLTQPVIDYVGELRYRRVNAPLAFASLRFVRTSGARLTAGDTVYGSSGPDGFFHLSSTAREAGFVVGDLLVRPNASDFPRPYTITGMRIPVRATDRVPSFDRSFQIGATLTYVAELRARGAGGVVANADVEFRRTSGPPLVADVVTGRTDASGRVALAPQPTSEAAGVLVGDITVRGGDLQRPFVIRGVRLPVYDDDQLRFLGVLGVGFQALAAGELVFRGDRSPLAEADVRFVRTRGLQTTPASVATRTGADGRFGVTLLADSAGEVVGDLIVVRGAGAAPLTFRDVRLAVTADDSVRFLGRFAFGQQLQYAAQLVRRADGRPAAGWTVTFRRTAGIALPSESFTAVTVDWGGFAIAPDTREEGLVEGTLTAREPGTGRDIVLGPVRLATFEGDEVRFAGTYRVGPSLLYVGELLRDDTGAPIADARVEFRRTGGIATAESLLVERSNAVGRFRLAPTPLAAGEVIGDLRIVRPAPLRDTVFTNVRLTTFESDDVRLRDVWRLAPPR